MNKRADYKTFRKKTLENPKVKAVYEALRPEFELVIALIEARKAAKSKSGLQMRMWNHALTPDFYTKIRIVSP